MKMHKVYFTKFVFHAHSDKPKDNIFMSKLVLLPFIPVPGMSLIPGLFGEYLNDAVSYDVEKNHFVVKTSGERTKENDGVKDIVKTFKERGWNVITRKMYSGLWRQEVAQE